MLTWFVETFRNPYISLKPKRSLWPPLPSDPPEPWQKAGFRPPPQTGSRSRAQEPKKQFGGKIDLNNKSVKMINLTYSS